MSETSTFDAAPETATTETPATETPVETEVPLAETLTEQEAWEYAKIQITITLQPRDKEGKRNLILGMRNEESDPKILPPFTISNNDELFAHLREQVDAFIAEMPARQVELERKRAEEKANRTEKPKTVTAGKTSKPTTKPATAPAKPKATAQTNTPITVKTKATETSVTPSAPTTPTPPVEPVIPSPQKSLFD